MILCGCEINRNEKRPVSLPVPGGGSIEAVLICGAHEGKTLIATAGVHGCEYSGVEALLRLSRELEPHSLHGQVVLVPVVNSGGFFAGAKQVVPSDGINLNRAFPGSADGSESARIACAVETLLYPYADLMIDLHSGDVNEMAMTFVYFHVDEQGDCNDIREAAKALSVDFRVGSTTNNGLYSQAACRGIMSLLLERGGMGRWSMEDVEAYKNNIYELMDYMNILKQDFPLHVQREIGNAVYIEAESEGLWYPRVKEGQAVLKGMVLGDLKDLEGALIRRYEAEFDGIVLYYTLSLGVNKKTPLIAVGQLG